MYTYLGMKNDSQDLLRIGQNVIKQLQERAEQGIRSPLSFADYHGFQKSYLPDELLQRALEPFSYSSETIQIEIVRVVSDLRDQVHYHERSTAYVYALGDKVGLQDPKEAYAYQEDSWVVVKEGDGWMIPPRTPHGFTVNEGGVFFFLSIQTPPIVHHGLDDYHLVKTA